MKTIHYQHQIYWGPLNAIFEAAGPRTTFLRGNHSFTNTGSRKTFQIFLILFQFQTIILYKKMKMVHKITMKDSLTKSLKSILQKKNSLGALHFHCFSQHGTETQTTEMKGWNLICPRIENNFVLLSHLGPFVISWRMR